MTVSTVSVASPDTANLAVPSVTFARSSFSGQERLTVTAGLSNKGDEPLQGRAGHARRSTATRSRPRQATIARARVRLGVVHAVHARRARTSAASVRAGTDPLPADNTFHFVLTPSEPVSLLIVDSGDRGGVEPVPVEGAVDRHHAGVPGRGDVGVAADAGDARQARGGHPERHDVSAGRRRRRAEEVRRARRRPARGQRRAHDLAAGRSGPAARQARRDRRSHRPAAAASLGYLDYSHPVFEVFKAPRSGDFSAAHVFRYRALQTDARPIASSRASTMARSRRRSGRSAAAASIVLDDDARRLVDRPRGQAGLPAAGPPARPLSRRTTSRRRRG